LELSTQPITPRWTDSRVDESSGRIIWDCTNGDAVVIEAGAYVAYQSYDLPDGGQGHRAIGRYTTFRIAARALSGARG
jgi:hypothetical protein